MLPPAKLARKLLELSLADGRLSSERVNGVLEYCRKQPTSLRRKLLAAYLKQVRREIQKTEAVIEHAGPINQQIIASVTASLAQIAGKPVSATTRENPALIAGLRVRLGDDVWDNSVADKLRRLAHS